MGRIQGRLRRQNATTGMPHYFLIDTWRHKPPGELYVDTANVKDHQQYANFKAAAKNVRNFWPHVSMLQLSSREAVSLFKDDSLGLLYLDARHDYCAVREELELYWPKIAPGGVAGGDDFGLAPWDLCENGT